jgi:sugar/nucleoside kinase (ribokinase family)
MPFRVVTVGDLVADLVVQLPSLQVAPGVYQEAHSISIEPGGAGNFLIAGARLGVRMIAIGVLGDDVFGREVGRILHDEGVEMSLVARSAEGGTTAVLVMNDDAGQTLMTGAYGVGTEVAFDPRWAQAIADADAVFAFGYSLREARVRRAVLTSLQLARQHGRPVYFDPGPEFRLLDAALRHQVLTLVDVLLLTADEVVALGADTPAAFLGLGIRRVVVKRGAAGCSIVDAHGDHDAPGAPVAVRDVAGAGDCFAAAYLFGVAQGWPDTRIAAVANAMGAAMVQRRGTGRHAPTLDDVRAVLAAWQPEYLW